MRMGLRIITAGVVCLAVAGCTRPSGGDHTAVRSAEPSDYQKMVDCSSRTEAWRKLEEEDKGAAVQVFSHWNRALQKCFAKIEVSRTNADGRGAWVMTAVRDAYEGRVYVDWFTTPPTESGSCMHYPLGEPPVSLSYSSERGLLGVPERTSEACEAKIREYLEESVRPDLGPK